MTAANCAWLRDQWRDQPRMWEDHKVMVHGDATPDNFMFGNGLEVTTFDLERAKRADRVFDTGRIAGELKHFFMRATGNRDSADPFIGHFLLGVRLSLPEPRQRLSGDQREDPVLHGNYVAAHCAKWLG